MQIRLLNILADVDVSTRPCEIWAFWKVRADLRRMVKLASGTKLTSGPMSAPTSVSISNHNATASVHWDVRYPFCQVQRRETGKHLIWKVARFRHHLLKHFGVHAVCYHE
jgi:hypothetical protein